MEIQNFAASVESFLDVIRGNVSHSVQELSGLGTAGDIEWKKV